MLESAQHRMSISELVQSELDAGIERNVAIITLSYGDTAMLSALKREACSRRVGMLSRPHGAADGWVHVRRSTF